MERESEDSKAGVPFFCRHFGCKFQYFAPGYLIYLPENGGVSVGIMKSDKASPGDTPSVSDRVMNIDQVLSNTEEFGGRAVVAKTDLNSGYFGFLKAPDENIIGVQQV